MKTAISTLIIATVAAFATEANAWQRGDRGYICYDPPGQVRLLSFGMIGKTSCEVRVLEVAGSSTRVEIVGSCSVPQDGWHRGAYLWIDGRPWSSPCD